MKFCEKLQKIRKENNITQEELASRLDVSRQAVSKWESGSAYPDTEKLIQISKIFKVSLDELINDDVDIKKENNSEKKFNFGETVEIGISFIQKTFSMFWSMTFKEKIKFLFEMCILILALMIGASIAEGIVLELARRLFAFLPDNLFNYLIYMFDSLLYVLFIIVGTIIVVRIIKSRYLDYYIIINDDSVSERVTEEPIKELKEKKDYKVVIRDPADSSLHLLRKFGKVILFFIKIIAFFIALPIIASFITVVIMFTISLGFIFSGLFFNGITIVLLGVIFFIYLILLFIYNLIFNRKNAYGKIFILFICSLILMGVGFGLAFSNISSFKVYESEEISNKDEITISMDDNLIIPELMHLSDDKIVFGDYDNIKMDVMTYDNGELGVNYLHERDEDRIYKVCNMYVYFNSFDSYKNILKDLKQRKINKTLFDTDGIYEIDKVYISQDNFTKLRENYEKLYNKEVEE